MKKITAVVCIVMMLLSVTATSSFGADTQKTYTHYASYDFENQELSANIVSGKTLGDTQNPSNYIIPNRTTNTKNEYIDFSGGINSPGDEFVIDFRAKKMDNPANPSYKTAIQVIFDNWKWWLQWDIDNTFVNRWTYYRLVVDTDEATQNSEVVCRAYYSPDMLSWTQLPNAAIQSVNTLVPGSKITQIRYSRLNVDDMVMYSCSKAPLGSDASIMQDGKSLTASYNYSDPDGDPEGESVYQWQTSDDNINFKNVSDAVSKVWTPSSSENGKYVRCVITPKSQRYPTDGADIVSQSLKLNIYEDVFSEDYEEHNPETDATIIDGDGVNTTKFKSTTGNIDVRIDAICDEMVIDFRAKSTNNNYHILQIVFDYWNANVAWVMNASMGEGYISDWRYYRIFIDSNEAQTPDEITTEIYWSDNGILWNEAYTNRISKEYKDNLNPTDKLSNLTQLRFSGCHMDDIKVYKYGHAPVAKNASVSETSGVYKVSCDYHDADGDEKAIEKYQWQISGNNSDYTDIEGATECEYTPDPAYAGKYLRCLVTPFSPYYPCEGEVCITKGVKIRKTEAVEDVYSENFENSTHSKVVSGSETGDSVNTSQYLNVESGSWDISGQNLYADGTVMDFRAKPNGGRDYFTMIILNDWTNNYINWSINNATSSNCPEWTYYRIVFDTTRENGEEKLSLKIFSSADGISYTESDSEYILSKGYMKLVGNPGLNATPIKQIRMYQGMLDDVRIYKSGEAPEATNAVIIKNGNTLTATFDYADAEGDEPGEHIYQWQYSTDNVTYNNINDATSSVYEIEEKYAKMFIRCVITPVSVNYPLHGKEVATESVSDISYAVSYAHYDSKGREVFCYDISDSLTSKFEISNNGPEDMPVTVVSAVYDKSGNKLLGVNCESATAVSKGAPAEITIKTPSQKSDNTYVKFMVINSLSTLVPYSKPIELKAKSQSEEPTLFLIGDSICADYGMNMYPRQGWGYYLGNSFEGIKVSNRAVSGWTTDHYLYPEERNVTNSTYLSYHIWESVIKDIKPGDYVLIGLGINDSNPTTGVSEERYLQNLEKMYEDATKLGATVLFSTPTIYGGEEGSSYGWTANVNDRWYKRGMVCKGFADSKNATCLLFGDAVYNAYNTMYFDYKSEKGCSDAEARDYVRHYFHLYKSNLMADETATPSGWNLTEDKVTALVGAGGFDQTHYSERGSETLAGIIASLIEESDSSLKDYLK